MSSLWGTVSQGLASVFSPGGRESVRNGPTAEERDAVLDVIHVHNQKITRLLMLPAVVTVIALGLVDAERWQEGLLHRSALHQGLALTHAAFLVATLIGLTYCIPRMRAELRRGDSAFNFFLVLFIGSIASMSLLGIGDRGSTTLVSVALMLANLVFRLSVRAVVVFNVVLLTAAVSLRLIYGAGFASVMVGLFELMGLCMVTLVAGYGLSSQMFMNALGELREARRHRVLQEELEIATRVQRSLLPHRWPQDPAFGLFGVMNPARNVGGDYFDHFALNDDRLGLVIADVSDKGVAAGLFGMMCKTASRSAMLRHASIEAAFESINVDLSLDNDECMFVTCIGASYQPSTGDIQLVNAGHVAPLLIRAGGDLEWVRAPRCPVLGVRPDAKFGAVMLRLAQGDTLLLITDGVTEAMKASGEPFGTDRVEATLRGLRADDPHACVDALVAAVAAFTAGVEPSDDITCLALLHRSVPG